MAQSDRHALERRREVLVQIVNNTEASTNDRLVALNNLEGVETQLRALPKDPSGRVPEGVVDSFKDCINEYNDIMSRLYPDRPLPCGEIQQSIFARVARFYPELRAP